MPKTLPAIALGAAEKEAATWIIALGVMDEGNCNNATLQSTQACEIKFTFTLAPEHKEVVV